MLGHMIAKMRCEKKVVELSEKLANEIDDQKKIDLQNEIDSFNLKKESLKEKIVTKEIVNGKVVDKKPKDDKPKDKQLGDLTP